MSRPVGAPIGLRPAANGPATPTLNGQQQQGGRAFSPQGVGAGVRQNSNVTRAERFEDEKHRIIESCFSKLDTNGQLAESYITHVRITEDAQYPSQPPPPESAPDNKKPRLIVIAVRSTGRVRMHKARENANGSFSIGKTWNLEELSVIESFSQTGGDRDAQMRQWAGSTGFTVTITKPYFWQAGTTKEKEFFIASAVKIYRKYTRGQVPELRGFNDTELSNIVGIPGQTSSIQQPAVPPQPLTVRRDSSPAPPQPPFAQREHSRDGSRYRGSPGPPPSLSDQSGAPLLKRESESPARHKNLSQPPGPRQFASQEQMRNQSPAARTDFRPGTSPAPGLGQTRNPPPSSIFNASQNPSQTQLRVENVVSTREAQALSQKPQRPMSPPESHSVTSNINNKPEQAQDSQVPTHTTINNQQRSKGLSEGAPQLPPINTLKAAFSPSLHADFKSPAFPNPATTETSVPIRGSAVATNVSTPAFPPPAQPFAQTAGSPQTPERSRRRPQADQIVSDDLRPEPLLAASRPSSSKSHNRGDGASVASSTFEAPADVKPLIIGQPRTSQPSNESQTSLSRDVPQLQDEASRSDSAMADEPDLTPSDEQYRPGLGPMIKKGTARDRFKKAAFAAGAFKPRPGGAAEKIMRAKAEREAGNVPEPDGITSVVPRPQALQPKPKVAEDIEPASAVLSAPTTPQVEASSPQIHVENVPTPTKSIEGVQLTDEVVPEKVYNAKRTSAPQAEQTVPEADEDDSMHDSAILELPVKAKVRSQHQNQYLDELGIDRGLVEGKGLEFEAMLEEFGWNSEALQPSRLLRLEHDIQKEQARLEAGSWLSTGADSARDERVAQVEALLDKTIAECDELDGLLTLYSVELGSLNDDVVYIEAQSQGLQVQAANQQLLQSELQGLLQTMTLDRRALEPLRHANLGDDQQLEEVEQGLVRLYQAMITLDPKIRSSGMRRARQNAFASEEGSELATMRAVRDKKEVYHRESSVFCQRLMQHLDTTFMTSFNDAKKHSTRPSSYKGNSTNTVQRINKDALADARRPLWMYSPLLLFTKEIDAPAWGTILRMYYSRAQPLYTDAFGQNVAGWKKVARKPVAEEAELLFTTALKQEATVPGAGPASMGLAAARKLTVKRSATLARTLRHAGGDKHVVAESRQQANSLMSSEVFAGALDEMAPLVSQEQNFIVDFFHATSLEGIDFLDVVRASRPEERVGNNLLDRKPIEPDREMAKRVHGLMAELYESNFGAEMQRLVEWSISQDPLQGVGVLACLAKHAFFLQDTSQEYLAQAIEALSSKLQARWSKFVEEQIRAIEDTKVKIKKRKGVIGFMKVFPNFTAAVENIFSAVAGMDYEGPAESVVSVRRFIDDAYAAINRAMFDSLKVIATESPTAGAQTAQQQAKGGLVGQGEDPEDKEILNFHILMIENMNHYIEGVDDGGREGVLAEWRGRAMFERTEALDAYVSRVLKRPLGKLIDFLESVNSLLSTSTSPNPQAIAARPSYSRKAARNLLAQCDAKEVRRGIDTLRRRIEKHFGEADEEAFSRQLVGMVCKECERGYERVLEQTENMIREVYPAVEGEKPVEVDFTIADIQAGFRR